MISTVCLAAVPSPKGETTGNLSPIIKPVKFFEYLLFLGSNNFGKSLLLQLQDAQLTIA